jgi:hypothetical protein
MYTGKLVFSQIMEHLPLHIFHQRVARYQGNFRGSRIFLARSVSVCVAFAQLTYQKNLRKIEACLRTKKNKLYHMGIRSNISRNTLDNKVRT